MFTNCEPDINTEIKAKESNRFNIQNLNREQIRSKKHITEKLEDLNLENAASHDNQNKIVYNGSYGFTVNTDLVKYVEDLETGNHSYSFSIQRDSTITNNLENLLLQYNPADSDYYAYIVQYAFTNDELQDLNETFLNSTNTIIFPIDYDISTLELGKMTWGCVSNGHWVNNTDHNGELHGANCTCDSESTWVVTEVTCGYYDDGSGSGDGSTNSPWIPNTGNEPGGGYGDPNNPNNNGSGPTEIFAAPTPTQTQAELLATYLDLNIQQEIWANKSTNLDKVRAINNYLFTNCGADTNSSGCQQAQAFAATALVAEMEDGEVDWDEQIIYDSSLKNYPCHKIVIEDAIGTCSPLTQIVLNAFEADDYVNLIIKTSNNITGNANTSSVSSYNPVNQTCNITITFRESYLQTATDLSIARTAIHESFYAILVYMYEENLLFSQNGLPLVGFENFVEAYTDYLSGLPRNLGVAHHILMSDFIEDMATSLSAYGSDNGYSNSFNFYKRLCWSGDLINTPTFQSLYPKYLVPTDATNNPANINPDYLDIINTNAAEQNNASYSYPHPNGTTYQHSPIGNAPNSNEPCN